MLEPDEIDRWERLARSLAAKADDAEGVAQVLDIIELFECHAMAAVERLTTDRVYSFTYLASARGQSGQALHQRLARYLRRPRQGTPPAIVPMRHRPGWWRWRCRCATWQHCPDEHTARRTAAEHADVCVIRPRQTTAHLQAVGA